MQEKARLQAQENEASKSMYRQEQAEAEELYQKEVGKSAELVERLKEAERGQVGKFDCRERTEMLVESCLRDKNLIQ